MGRLADDRPDAKGRSLASLDALNVCMADVRDGLGPYLAIYLAAVRHWDAGRIGVAMAVMTIATVVAQTPAGALIDAVRGKRGILILAAVAVAAGSIAMALRPTFAVIVAAQATIGVAVTIIPPAIAAITLGLVGHAHLSRRMGRNEAFNHAGNVAAALLAALIGDHIAYVGIFYLVAAMSAASIVSTLAIRDRDIDHAVARGAAREDDDGQIEGVARLGTLFRDGRIPMFILSVTLFHFANAAMLPLVGQKLIHGRSGGVSTAMSACIIAAQLVMIPVALLSSRLADSWGRKPVFLVGFAILPIRGLLYILSANPYFLVAVQLLDGIGAGIFGVVGVLVIADLTRGTGRFNLMQGALATAIGIGASLSNLLTGFIVEAAGFNAGFLFLAPVAAAALAFYALAMPETGQPEGGRGLASDPQALPSNS